MYMSNTTAIRFLWELRETFLWQKLPLLGLSALVNYKMHAGDIRVDWNRYSCANALFSYEIQDGCLI